MQFEKQNRTWVKKFADAFAGIWKGARDQKSFLVHIPAAIVAIALAAAFKIDVSKWIIIVICICCVLVAELLNSALEQMAKAVTDEYNEHVKTSLNIASGAVLVSAFGAAVCGAIIFCPKIWGMLFVN